MLSCDIANVRRYEMLGRLPCIVAGGVHYFKPEDVERLQLDRIALKASQSAPKSKPLKGEGGENGEVTAAVFAQFREGVDPTLVVENLKVPSSTIEILFARWQRMGGGVYITKVDAAKLAAKSLYLRNLKSAVTVDLLAAALETQKCPQCSGELTQECSRCNPRRPAPPEGSLVLRKEQVARLASLNPTLAVALAKAQDVASILRALEIAVDPARVACQECAGPVAPFCETHGGTTKPTAKPAAEPTKG
jgi:hypothetical protein